MLAVILAYATVGALLILRRHGHPIGWLLTAAGLALSASILSTTVGARLLLDPGLGVAASAIAWIQTWGVVLAVVLAGPILVLVFPSGHVPRDRWRWALGPLAAGTAATTIGTAFAPGPMGEGQPVNPLGLEALAPLVGPVQVAGILLIVVGTIGSGAAIIVRF